MRYLITGITGFVGSHMADYILKQDSDAMIFACRRWRSRDENIKHLYDNSKVKFIEADLLDNASLYSFVEEARPDYVFHFAAQSFPGASFKVPVATLTTNGIGTVNLMEALLQVRETGLCDPIIISISSSEVYGMPLPEEVPIKETNPIRAANPYSISKVTHDLMSQYYQKAFGLKIIITRMFSHEGKRRGKEFALSSFARQIAVNEDRFEREVCQVPYIIKVGNLNSVRTYAHIDDAIRAYWYASVKGKVGEIYNIGGKHTCTVGDALENLLSKSIIPRQYFKIVVDPALIRPTDITLQIPDCTKFKEHTGWDVVKTLDDINQDLLDYWRGNI
ncbi:MAG: GDP-mannose 4,6-dehydratase [Methanogenium sp.]|jgi:GDP-mannose 4,6-dehydratase